MNFKSITKKFSLALTAMTLFGTLSTATHAAPIIPTYNDFGFLDTEFGGDGIPNQYVAISSPFRNITLGLSAHGRYQNTVVGNNGAGVFYATQGANAQNNQPNLAATWNFSFYVGLSDSSLLNDYAFSLFYDFDPAANNDESTHGLINLNPWIDLTSIPFEQSQNLTFGFLSALTPGFLTPPEGTYDPYAAGEYTFALTAFELSTQSEVARSAIKVVVGTPTVDVPAPATAMLLAGGLLLLRLRRRN